MTAKVDRVPFRELILPLLESPDWQVRLMALVCLRDVTTDASDVAAIARLAGDPSERVRAEVASTLVRVGNGEQREIVVPALKKLLADADEDVVTAAIRSQWGEYPDPELDAQFVALAKNPNLHHIVIYNGLSTQKSKSAAVCKRLVEELADPDWNNSGRAAWGLTYGVPEEAYVLVEEGLLKAIPEETNNYTRGEEFKALENVASEKSRDYLTNVAANESETDSAREAAKRILAKLDAAKK